MSLRITIDQQQIINYCRKHHIQKLSFFGSVLREDFRQDSDVDVLVEFEKGHVPSLLTLMDMQEEFSELIGRQADFRTPNDLGRYIRERVMASAEVQYAA
ncbi:MAG TPA: nucleotidyltransferase domain-containing protein [Armatimonadota bacterium]